MQTSLQTLFRGVVVHDVSELTVADGGEAILKSRKVTKLEKKTCQEGNQLFIIFTSFFIQKERKFLIWN